MSEDAPNTRDRLVAAAALLFRQKGYHGVGLAEILAAAGAPKGSLYHHFPDGKRDLAIAAADWASEGMLRIIADSFRGAETYRDGATTLCYKLAKFFDISGHWDGCPVSSILFEGPENEPFRSRADAIFGAWIDAVAAEAVRLGIPAAEARDRAETLLMSIQGAWVLARARRNSDVLRRLPGQILR